MRAALVEEAYAAIARAEDDEVFAEQTDLERGSVGLELYGARDGVPVAPHHAPHGGFRPDAADAFVLFSAEHDSAVLGRLKLLKIKLMLPRIQ